MMQIQHLHASSDLRECLFYMIQQRDLLFIDRPNALLAKLPIALEQSGNVLSVNVCLCFLSLCFRVWALCVLCCICCSFFPSHMRQPIEVIAVYLFIATLKTTKNTLNKSNNEKTSEKDTLKIKLFRKRGSKNIRIVQKRVAFWKWRVKETFSNWQCVLQEETSAVSEKHGSDDELGSASCEGWTLRKQPFDVL